MEQQATLNPDPNPNPSLGPNLKPKNKTIKKRRIVVKQRTSPIQEPVLQESVLQEPIKITAEEGTNDYLLQKEKVEHDSYKRSPSDKYDFLYPDLNDPEFNIKIAQRKEFNDTQYDGTIYPDIEERANILCNSKFELLPHQLFVKNFLSFQTPYNSLLLFYGLGTGKSCAAIGIAEETRNYMKQVGLEKRILFVASPNVRSNFKMQLFDERKLESRTDANDSKNIWSIESCVGNSLLREINPTNLKGLTKEAVKTHINGIINTYYEFIGYGKLANYISEKMNLGVSRNMNKKELLQLQILNIKREFNNRLIIIDEVHNIRLTDDNNIENKKTATLLFKVAQYTDNLRFLFLSATPMFNSYKEIIWLTNLMNVNDKRGTIELSDVFEKNGDFKLAQGGLQESGKELLMRKLTGYISYIRGENPYAFPFRIYPSLFAKEHTFLENTYPTIQMNSVAIDEPLKYISVYLSHLQDNQLAVYNFMIENLRRKSYSYFTKKGTKREMPNFENMESFGYSILQQPLQSLNIIYPNTDFDKLAIQLSGSPELAENVYSGDHKELISSLIGKKGLANIMTSKKVESPNPMRYNFEYKPEIMKKYGAIFKRENLYKYSAKIARICDIIMKSTGIVLIYSQFIDGGILPVALALEEMGFSRYGTQSYTKPLFKNVGVEPIDAIQLKPRSQTSGDFHQAKYIMITGDKDFSPSNAADVKYATSENNKNGEKVKVILISRTGSEGIDFKNIRQVHVLEPWFNMNRIEQIIGRGVRNLSHCNLPFRERNVEIYLHSTLLGSQEESADLYLYRFSMKKAIEIGKITRLLKQISVDCILNQTQQNFTVENMDTKININLSSRNKETGEQIQILYEVGDREHTELCDYMDSCHYQCSPSSTKFDEKNIIKDTYNESFVKINQQTILEKIRQIFLEKSVYTRKELIISINLIKQYPIEQIYSVLTYLIKNKNEYLIDRYGRIGNLVNKDNLYLFQPVEINDETVSIYDRTTPIDYKRRSFSMELPKTIREPEKIQELEEGSLIIRETKKSQYEKIIGEFKKNLEEFNSEKQSTEKVKANESWYKNCGRVFNELSTKYAIPENFIYKHVVEHMLDIIPISEKLIICDYILSRNREPLEDTIIEPIVQQYFEKRVLRRKLDDRIAVVLADDVKYNMFIKPETENETVEHWIPVEPAEKDLFIKDSVEAFSREFIIERKDTKLNTIIGFMIIFKEKMVFKIKIINKKKGNKGSYCFNAGKNDVIKLLNTLLDDTVYNTENTENINQNALCCLFEVLVRYYTETQKDGKIYFLTPEQTIINGIPEYAR